MAQSLITRWAYAVRRGGDILRFAVSLVSAAITAAAAAAEPAPPPPTFQVAPDFFVEQVAGTEQVVFPMFAAFDGRGRLFVAESSGLDLYAEISAGTRMCRVKLLEDKDGDGRFEASRVFADGLVFPRGLVWRKGTRQTADSVVLRSASGADVQLRRNQIQEMSRVAASIMPEGLEQGMTPEEFRD